MAGFERCITGCVVFNENFVAMTVVRNATITLVNKSILTQYEFADAIMTFLNYVDDTNQFCRPHRYVGLPDGMMIYG